MTLFWLSFVDEHRSLGVAIVEAEDTISAVLKARRLGINPGGEVCSAEIPEESRPKVKAAERNRLIQLDELESLWGPMTTLGELRDQGRVVESNCILCEQNSN